MTIKEAIAKEIQKRNFYVIPPLVKEECQMCHRQDELRGGVCWDCMSFVETDMKEVWEIASPAHRWAYVWSTSHLIAMRTLNG